jgi:hypothetical protein
MGYYRKFILNYASIAELLRRKRGQTIAIWWEVTQNIP